MRASICDKEIYFDVEGAGLVVDGTAMREKPVAFVIHGVAAPGLPFTRFAVQSDQAATASGAAAATTGVARIR